MLWTSLVLCNHGVSGVLTTGRNHGACGFQQFLRLPCKIPQTNSPELQREESISIVLEVALQLHCPGPWRVSLAYHLKSLRLSGVLSTIVQQLVQEWQFFSSLEMARCLNNTQSVASLKMWSACLCCGGGGDSPHRATGRKKNIVIFFPFPSGCPKPQGPQTPFVLRAILS